jgi:hypothetical protein
LDWVPAWSSCLSDIRFGLGLSVTKVNPLPATLVTSQKILFSPRQGPSETIEDRSKRFSLNRLHIRLVLGKKTSKLFDMLIPLTPVATRPKIGGHGQTEISEDFERISRAVF